MSSALRASVVMPFSPSVFPSVSFLSAVENSLNVMGVFMSSRGGCCVILSRMLKSNVFSQL